jgi:hypothetical protein
MEILLRIDIEGKENVFPPWHNPTEKSLKKESVASESISWVTLLF